MQYKLCPVVRNYTEPKAVIRINDDASICSIPFSPANADYSEFKKAVTAGAELQDADGNVMTEQATQDFIRTLP